MAIQDSEQVTKEGGAVSVVGEHRSAVWLVVAVVILAIIAGGIWGVARYLKQAASPHRPAFSAETQFVPPGAASLEIEHALAALGFSSPPPYFDVDNVLQSLALSPSVSSATTSSVLASSTLDNAVSDNAVVGNRSSVPARAVFPFLSYRIYNRDKAVIRSTFLEYLEGAGWKMTDTPGENILIFFSAAGQPLFVSLLEVTAIGEADSPVLVVTLSGQ